MQKNKWLRLVNALHSSEKREYEQGYIRLIFGTLASLYFSLIHYNNYDLLIFISATWLGYVIFSFCVLYWIAKKPVTVVSRCIIVIVTDILSLSLVIFFVGEYFSGVLFFIYLWVIVGYAYRFGEKYMWFAVTLSTTSYLLVISFWNLPVPIVTGQFLILIVIPYYISKFIRLNDASLKFAIEANQHKSRFLANMNHELRTPLNSILVLSDLISQEKDIDKINEFAVKIEKSGDQLLSIINAILDYSSLESRVNEVQISVLSLTELVSHVVDVVSPQARLKNLKIETIITSDARVLVFSDEIKLRQLLINLLFNAVKFTETGRVSLKVDIARSNLDDKERTSLRFEVTDTGIGIPEDKTEQIFNEFVQADESITRRYGGTGLGLAICKQIVIILDGQIGVDSITGQGSTFWFELPLRISDSNEHDLSLDNSNLQQLKFPRQLSILIAEDNLENQYVYQQVLSAQRFNLDIANDGKEAIEKMKSNTYDIAIMDHQMPYYSGYEVMQKYREDINGEMKLILLSADISNATKKLYMPWADVIESKPIKPKRLLSIICEQANGLANSENKSTDIKPEVLDFDKVLDKNLIRSNSEYVNSNEHFKLFTVSFEKQYRLLSKSIIGHEPERTENILHSLKSGAGQAGALLLYRLIGRYMVTMPSSVEALDLMLGEMDNVYQKTCKEYTNFLSDKKNGGSG